MEQLILTAPITTYRVMRLHLDWEHKVIQITLRGPAGEAAEVTYLGDVAEQMLRTLNTANLSTKSLHKRILERLILDGKLIGTIDGVPD